MTCPRWGTQQIVKARVGISTDYIRYLCKNINCSGAFHMFAINPTVRAMMTSKLANPHPEDDGAEDVPLTPKGRRRAPKRKPKAEPVKGKTGKTPPKS